LFQSDNDQSRAFAQQHSLLGTAGSDAHSWLEYGQSVTRLKPFRDSPEFLVALREAEFIQRLSPAYVHGFSTLAKWSKKLGFSPRQWPGG
jgi:hypothetical protein